MDAFVQLIRDAAAQLGIAATQVWPHVVATTFYQSLVMFIMVGLFFLSIVVFQILGWRSVLGQTKAMREAGYDPRADDTLGWMAWLTVAFIVMMILCLLLLPHAVSGVFEPEGQTVRDLIGK